MSITTNLFKSNGDISFVGLRKAAMELLPNDRIKLDKLYEDLNRGVEILDDEDHLNMYLRSYGNMHKAKLDYAFKCVPQNLFSNEIEIFDWGCGQGTATICLLDYLRSQNINASIKQITLIDPSEPAVVRADELLKCYNEQFNVVKVTKDFDSLTIDCFNKDDIIKLHLFSNILDVELFDLSKFIHLFQILFNGENYFVCVGPFFRNSRRVNEFISAIENDEMYGIMDLDKGQWVNEWTIQLRVFRKVFKIIEPLQNIRKRIEDSYKKEQFFAGYILDCVSEEYVNSEVAELTEDLYRSLSIFDVKSNKPLYTNNNIDSKLAVLANIMSRGLPTKATIKIEKYFSDLLGVSSTPKEGEPLDFLSKHKISSTEIFEALHIIDPRFDSEFYNGDMLDSEFEKKFISKYLKNTEVEYLAQILEPQRPLSSIVNIPDHKFSKDQRVDFAIEIPYGDSQSGFIIELDGAPYHSNIFERIRDERRDRYASESRYDTYRLDNMKDYSFVNSWIQEANMNRYLSIIKKNYDRKIADKWNIVLQVVLSPLAIARFERILLQGFITEAININKKEIKVLVVERDVPCTYLAIEDFKEKLAKIYELAGERLSLPTFKVTVVSTEEFYNSPLHLNGSVFKEIPKEKFDVCIDMSILLRDNIDALPLNVDSSIYYIIRSSHYKKRERSICIAENIVYPAFVIKDTTGTYQSIEEREKTLTYFLQNIFRKHDFRQGQLPILSRTLSDKTTIGLLPTGGGKSLTYQLSALLQPGVTIVVDPLISLMIDQIRGMKDMRIDACDCVNSTMEGKEKNKKLNLLKNGAVQFMLLSPERFMMQNFRDNLLAMTRRNHVYFAYGVIDEVHCVSEWGHDFRTSYLHLGRNMINFMTTLSNRSLSVIGLTATASFDVLADVERELTLGGNLVIDSETIVRPESDTRPELTYRIVEVKADFSEYKDVNSQGVLSVDEWKLKDVVSEAKTNCLLKLLREVPKDLYIINSENRHPECNIINYNPSDFYNPKENERYDNAGIIFCPHAHGTFGVIDSASGNHLGLSTRLIAKAPYLRIGTFIGGDKPSGDMKLFNHNKQSLMVATKAFGMGIDKPNIRFTVNFNHPSSIEGYVQEAGRGGRDKKNAISYVLYEPTEILHLTVDKINDIQSYFIYKLGRDNPGWLNYYRNKYVLLEDFSTICLQNHCSEDETMIMEEFIKEHDYVENVDKEIDLWFHNNSFRGLFKEKTILLEMTDRILNVKPTKLTEIQGLLRDETGNDDVLLKINANGNAIVIISQENRSQQYGYIFLDTLTPSYRYVNFDYNTCQRISNNLISLLNNCEDHSAIALMRPLEGEDNLAEGIYSAIEKSDADGYVYVTVSWENSLMQDYEDFERKIKEEINRIANQQEWNNFNEQRYGNLKLSNVDDFDELLAQITRRSGDERWLRYHNHTDIFSKLKKIFSQKRDKNDTDKAIYRMCCVGLVEDVTIDYNSQTYELKIKKQTDEQFKQNMLDFFRKYYSKEQAEKKVEQVNEQKGRNYIDKCLGYLTKFVYENLKKKRYRAIEDMRLACTDSITERKLTGNDDWLKEFIHLYFNSKYARTGYMVEDDNYSLTEDVEEQGRTDFDLVKKYIEIMTEDNSGSEVENVKHLYGATLLNLRAHPDNGALNLLLTYCVSFLGAGTNQHLKMESVKCYIEGFMSMYEQEQNKVWDYIDYYNSILSTKINDEYLKEKIVDNGKQTIMLLIHEEKFNDITNKYLNRNKDKDKGKDNKEKDN